MSNVVYVDDVEQFMEDMPTKDNITTLPADDPKGLRLGWDVYVDDMGMPEDLRKEFDAFDEVMANPQWERFMGNNHERIKLPIQSGGAVYFSEHLGKPLSVSLWKQLIGCLKLENIRIYKPRDAQWLDGRYNSANIYLDENDCVCDIVVFPECWHGDNPATPGPQNIYEGVGIAVINDYALSQIIMEN